MADRILMDDTNKLKITLVRDFRINFRYDGVLYSLQDDPGDLGEENIKFSKNVDDKWEYIGCCGYIELDVDAFVRKRDNNYFKNNYIYSHIDKEYFIKQLHNYRLIYAGVKYDIEALKTDLLSVEEDIISTEQNFNKDMKYLKKRKKELLNKISELRKET